MKKILDCYSQWNKMISVTGKEGLPPVSMRQENPFFASLKSDSKGNLFVSFLSENPKAKNVLLEAHRDEIGVCVKKIHPGGFVSVSPCGGFDVSILPGTVFQLFGKKVIPAVVSSVPPHLVKAVSKSDSSDFSSIFLDTGIKEGIEDFLSIGDVGRFLPEPVEMENGFLCASGLDNKACVIALQILAENLKDCPNHVHFLFSVGEESGSSGIKAYSEDHSIDYALVLDVGFGLSQGLDATKCIIPAKGPSVSFSDTLSRNLTKQLIRIANEKQLALQVLAEPGNTGTDGTILGLKQGGIPCALISIPLFNMHTPSEIIKVSDIYKTVDLLSAFLWEEL